MGYMHDWIEIAAGSIEALAVVVILGGIIYSFGRSFIRPGQQAGEAYRRFKHGIGKALLLGLEFLVAADIIRTVALSPTMQNIEMLGMLVLIRTFLSWSLVVEIEGRWPWQKREKTGPDIKEGMRTMLPPVAADAQAERSE